MSRGRCCRKHMHTWCIMTKPVGISWCICRDEGAIQSTMHAQCTKSEPVGKAGLYVRNCVEFWNVNCLVGPMKGSVLLYVWVSRLVVGDVTVGVASEMMILTARMVSQRVLRCVFEIYHLICLEWVIGSDGFVGLHARQRTSTWNEGGRLVVNGVWGNASGCHINSLAVSGERETIVDGYVTVEALFYWVCVS